MKYPDVLDKELVGTYAASAFTGGGYVWDAVLEYRVWCYLCDGATDVAEGSDYFYSFDNHEEAQFFTEETSGAEEPIALILQKEYIDEATSGEYIHMKEERITEWPSEFLARPCRNENTILDFFSPHAPLNRLDILRGN